MKKYIKQNRFLTMAKKKKHLTARALTVPIGLILVSMLVSLASCGKKAGTERTDMDPAFIWAGNQRFISPESGSKHTWSGFYVKDHFFVSYKHRSKLIIWRNNEGRAEVSMRYVISGDPVVLVVNEKRKRELIPAKSRQPVSFPVYFKKGFNLFEFKKREGTQLKIEFINVGKSVQEEPPDLETGKWVTAVLSPGSGQAKLKGKGRLEIRQVGFVNGTERSEKQVLAGKQIGFPFSFDAPGFIRINCLAGHFNLVDYSFVKKPAALEPLAMKTAGKPNVFIFLIDGCQQSHLGIYGYPRKTSPCIDKLAEDAVVFDNAYANATFTGSSVATIFTGMLPQRHKLKILINKLSGKHFLLSEFLKAKGYRTTILSEAGNISPRFGFGQGVDKFPRLFFRVLRDQRLMEKKLHQSFRDFTEKPGPMFAYLHFRAPHFPIIPPPPFRDMFRSSGRKVHRQRRLVFDIPELVKKGHRFTPAEIAEITDDYDSAIRFADDRVGRLIRRLKERGWYENSLIIFTSDHGEALYEHGELGHGFNVYNETSLVPLIVKFPASMNLKGRVERIVKLADIFPTVAALLNDRVDVDGQSLFQAVFNREMNDDLAISTSFHTIADFGIRWRDWYYLIRTKDNSEELYHLSVNPLEDVSGTQADVLLFLRGKFLNWLMENDQQDDIGEILDLKKLPKDVLDHLRTFGYIE
jgi:arylsulfatase A-like enzyme